MISKLTNPIQELFSDVKKIFEFMEVKDHNEAMKYETPEIREDSEMWMNALVGSDTYSTYRNYWTIAMFQQILPNVKMNNVMHWMDNPYNVPVNFRELLLTEGRQRFLDQHVEKNQYYRMLNGQPPIDTQKKDFIYLSDEIRKQLLVEDNIPVHELDTLVQNRYMSTDEYIEVIKANPDKLYLRYLGLWKIDIQTARKAKDFELIRFFPMNRGDINPNLLREFASLYNEYREYVMRILYNSQFEGIYENYRGFMKLLIQSFVLLQISNKSVEAFNNRQFLDDSILHIMLSLYGIPRSLLMTKEVRRNLVINLLKLTREKATDDVYYSLVKILGYQDVIIRKLLLLKNQDGDTCDPKFVEVDLKDSDIYETISNDDATIYSLEEITDNDPTWWNLEDTQSLLRDTHYTVADSKYIVVEAVINQLQFLFESIYFTRLILDNKRYTDEFQIDIPELFGTTTVSIYDVMVFILAATCMNNGMKGDIISQETKLLSVAGFNFDVDLELLNSFIDTSQYIDKSRIYMFLENLTMKTSSDINRLFNDVLYPMREWLESKISQTQNRHEFIEYEMLYRALFTYDINKNIFSKGFKTPIELIMDKYNLTEDELDIFQVFYPHNGVRKDNIKNTPYANINVEWFIDVDYYDKPTELYLYDILNNPDLRYLYDANGEPYLNPMFWTDGLELDENGIPIKVIDKEFVNEIILKIKSLDPDKKFNNASTVAYAIKGEKEIFRETPLPTKIKNEGVWKDILIDKITMDMKGWADEPSTYKEYLSRKNPALYNLLMDDRFVNDKKAWIENVTTVVLALETELNMHMKYFEYSVIGEDMFFKPLITLINRFKSMLVHVAKTGIRHMIGDKMDLGGSSNMLKLFDHLKLSIHFVILSNKGPYAQLGFYDTEHRLKYRIILKDQSRQSKSISDGTDSTTSHKIPFSGSLSLVDDLIIKK